MIIFITAHYTWGREKFSGHLKTYCEETFAFAVPFHRSYYLFITTENNECSESFPVETLHLYVTGISQGSGSCVDTLMVFDPSSYELQAG